MILNPVIDPSARLRGLLALLLLTLGLLAGVSLSRSQQAVQQQLVFDQQVLPTVKQVHALSRAVDEHRGMAALHLVQRGDAERGELEARMAATRQRVDRVMTAYGQRLHDAIDHRHHETVAASLTDFWAAQDRLLAASRHAGAEAAAQARALLAGESQQAFLRVRADLDAWWSYTEDAAAQASQLARAAAQQSLLLAAAGAALALGALAWQGVAALRRRRRQRAAMRSAAVLGGTRLDGPALQLHLQALNAAVAAARQGEPGRAAGLSGEQARDLADRVDAAARALGALIARPSPAQPADRGLPAAAGDPAR